tara:strand:- start:4025 stop:4726 length:702 start_codon:yes stop_codon:yes gene_type:complete
MSNIRIFFDKSLELNLTLKLGKSQSHYLSKVMRINIGENFSIFNKNGEWEAKVKNLNRGIIEFLITKKIRASINEKEICLAFAPIKMNYLNLMIQKATELGVTKFIPVLTERTIVRKLNEDRLKKIIIEASEQSNRLHVPELCKLIKLNEFLKLNQNLNLIFGDLNSDNTKVNLSNKESLCILIGPEGDFTTKERNQIMKFKKLIPLKINNNILRSETAAISMISIILFNLLS